MCLEVTRLASGGQIDDGNNSMPDRLPALNPEPGICDRWLGRPGGVIIGMARGDELDEPQLDGQKARRSRSQVSAGRKGGRISDDTVHETEQLV